MDDDAVGKIPAAFGLEVIDVAFGESIELDVDDLVARYLAGATPKEIAPEVGASAETVRRRLRARGVLLSKADATRRYFTRPEAIAQARAAQRVGTSKVRLSGLPEAEIVAHYVAGLSPRAIAEKFGCSTGPIARILREHDIALRDQSGAGQERWRNLGSAEREATLARLARVRGRPQTGASLAAAARTKSERFTQLVGPDEEDVLAILRAARYEVARQVPVGPYNLDLVVENIDIEVHRSRHGPHLNRFGRHRRVDYLTDHAWVVFYVWCPRGISKNDAEHIVANVEFLRSQPATLGEYFVFRCYGDHGPTRGGDRYKGTFVATTRSA